MGLYQNKSISQLFTLVNNTILQYFHLSFPLERKQIRYKNRNPWITQELKKNDISIQDELYKLKRRSPIPENIKITIIHTKIPTYQNKEKLREIITMNNLNNTRMT